MKRNHTEDRIHRYIANYLKLAAPEGFFWTSIENRNEGAVEGKRRSKRGCKAGVPDILTIYRGNVLFLEVKAPKGRLHDSQKERIPEINEAGAGVEIVRSVDDAFRALIKAGVPVRATPA
ncbi:VRR-NUC domain-containing protein [Bombella pollinis]|uniref:VRR-NUC domain-containing protein n=1 Tax=Bombella pollinis TaxID=2967337 RepID=A0ABT3WM33_9PROT|nr:VRR-NUC domain-containing protein [Bombella pollinis]MCX5620106.1 VRR-NUC domain-containing protein [Bombella pollinis]